MKKFLTVFLCIVLGIGIICGGFALANKLCEAITDSLRALRLRAAGYSVVATELTDPENTPKNTLLRAVLMGNSDKARAEAINEYNEVLKFVLGDNKDLYLKDF